MQDYKHIQRGRWARRREDRQHHFVIIGAIVVVVLIALVVRLANVIDGWGVCS
jgi:hypothetical protein